MKASRAETGRSSEWVLCIYEPNITASHVRVVLEDPEQLRDLNLANFVHAGNVATLSDTGFPLLALLPFDIAPHSPRVPTVTLGITSEVLRRPEFLTWAMNFGCTAEVRRHLDQVLAPPTEPATAVVPIIHSCALGWGLQRHNPDASAHFIQAVMSAPPTILSGLERYKLLTTSPATHSRQARQPLTLALLRPGHLAALYVRCVLAAPESVFPVAFKLSALQHRASVGSQQPLHEACTITDEPDLDLATLEDNVYDWVHEVLISPALSVADKQTLVNAWGTGGMAATKAAFDLGRYGVTAAILCAVLEAPTSVLTRSFQRGLPARNLTVVLAKLKATHSERNMRWIQRIVHAVRSNPKTFDQLLGAVTPYQKVLTDYVRPSLTPTVRALLGGTRGLSVRGADSTGPSISATHLRAVALDSNPAFMHCVSAQPVSELTSWSTDTSRRIIHTGGAALGDAQAHHYLLPVDRLSTRPGEATVPSDPPEDEERMRERDMPTVFHVPRSMTLRLR